mmetsp:Transcript_45430/g.120485  ORF Transcript_45430/g.120485 Transcript_45430/m.120485 type:complete len:85 (-) Transcript_45430:229-483(-)
MVVNRASLYVSCVIFDRPCIPRNMDQRLLLSGKGTPTKSCEPMPPAILERFMKATSMTLSGTAPKAVPNLLIIVEKDLRQMRPS